MRSNVDRKERTINEKLDERKEKSREAKDQSERESIGRRRSSSCLAPVSIPNPLVVKLRIVTFAISMATCDAARCC